MLPGKIPPDILSSLVFTHLGSRDPDLLLGPRIGEDASLIRIGKKVLVAATDPITGSVEDVGWLAVHVNANDVATFGIRPRWFLASIMLPASSSETELAKIILQIDEAAKSLDIAVAGGHTEITAGLDKPVVAGFMLGVADEGKYVTSSGAKPGDAIIMTKTAALEGTSILATEGEQYLSKYISKDLLIEGRRLRNSISVVREGIAAFETGHLTSMHDPTEGGLAGGIHEICDASNVGFVLNMDAIPVHEATKAICDHLKMDVLNLISSGCMLMTCVPEKGLEVVDAIHHVGINAKIIGDIVEETGNRSIMKGQSLTPLPRPKNDALWQALDQVTLK
ncbi:MAG: hydrogenase [Candidatus Thorarchaeota archaeon]|nr:hydrogenase [Candidatus Thorarchaeota archaeon]